MTAVVHRNVDDISSCSDSDLSSFLTQTYINTTGKMSLIDFGACGEYRKDFVDDYLKLVWSAANRDDAEIMRV